MTGVDVVAVRERAVFVVVHPLDDGVAQRDDFVHVLRRLYRRVHDLGQVLVRLFVANEPVAVRVVQVKHESVSRGVVAAARPERGFIFSNFSAHADGERRGLDRIGGYHRKDLGQARL